MKTKSGQLYMTKTERKLIEEMLQHCERDMSYGDGGSYGNENPKMHIDIIHGKEAVELVRWILKEGSY